MRADKNNPIAITINLQQAIDSLVKDVTTKDFNKNSLLKSKLALSLTLINMSIKSIPRLIQLFEFGQKIEEKIFDNSTIADITNMDELIELYKLSSVRQTETISFISSILNSLKWNDLEAALLIISQSTTNNNEMIESNKTAKEIISRIEEMKKSGMIKGNDNSERVAMEA